MVVVVLSLRLAGLAITQRALCVHCDKGDKALALMGGSSGTCHNAPHR